MLLKPLFSDAVDLLAKACAHAGIGVKNMVITSATFVIHIFNLRKKKKKKKKEKHEQMDGLVVFCQEV